jgi:hypothetical protein
LTVIRLLLKTIAGARNRADSNSLPTRLLTL